MKVNWLHVVIYILVGICFSILIESAFTAAVVAFVTGFALSFVFPIFVEEDQS